MKIVNRTIATRKIRKRVNGEGGLVEEDEDVLLDEDEQRAVIDIAQKSKGDKQAWLLVFKCISGLLLIAFVYLIFRIGL